MEVKEAIQVLKDHNKWRKGEDETAQMTDPKKIGIAIDKVISEFENLFISGVVKSLPNIDSIIVEPLKDYLERTGNFNKVQSELIAKNFYNYIDDYDIDIGI